MSRLHTNPASVSTYSGGDRAGKTYLDSHTLEVVERIDKTLDIASVAHLIGSEVMFEEGAIDIVVGWITVDESIEKEGVERKAPILWRSSEVMVLPCARVV